jgi:hypothetical protein
MIRSQVIKKDWEELVSEGHRAARGMDRRNNVNNKCK